MNNYPSEWPAFFTATILHWKPLLMNNDYKQIILDSLRFCVLQKRVKVYAFVIMSNHIHLIWQVLPPFTKAQVQLSFMKYTAQQIKFDLQKTNRPLLEEFKVKAKDRVYQIWKRNSLSIDLFSPAVFHQKVTYIHDNPVKAQLCLQPEKYYYSSARFHQSGIDDIGFLTHYNE
jgi:putative transposase